MSRSVFYHQNASRIQPISSDTAYWVRAKKIASDIVREHADKMDVPSSWRLHLTKLGGQAVAGIRFYMTFEVEGDDGITSTYAANVWLKPALMGTQLNSLEKITGSGKRKRNLFPPQEHTEQKKPSKSMTNGTQEDLVFGKFHCKLRTHGFNIFLEQIRSKRPTLKFTAARKSAASKWRRLPEHEKTAFMEKAVEKLNKETASSYKLTMRPNVCECHECSKPL